MLPAIRRTGRYVAPSAQAEVLPPSGDTLFGVPLPASVSTLRTSHRIQLLMGAIQLAKMPEEQARLVAEQFGRLCDTEGQGRGQRPLPALGQGAPHSFRQPRAGQEALHRLRAVVL